MQTKEEIQETYEALNSLLKDDKIFCETVQRIFMDIDKDNSGALDKDEVKEFLEKICHHMGITKPPSSKHIELIFKELDADKSGTISVKELGFFMKSLFEQMRHDMGRRLKTMKH